MSDNGTHAAEAYLAGYLDATIGHVLSVLLPGKLDLDPVTQATAGTAAMARADETLITGARNRLRNLGLCPICLGWNCILGWCPDCAVRGTDA
ncbi:hypothetical protein [Nocardia sp. IFM 10818]